MLSHKDLEGNPFARLAALWCAAQKSRPSLLQRSIGDVLAIRQNVGRHSDEWALRRGRADPKGENVSRCEESE